MEQAHLRVFIADPLEAEGLNLLRAAGLELDVRPGLKGADLWAALAAADGCIVRSGTRITAEALGEPGKLRAVVRAGVGVDNIDLAAATRRGVVVMNTPGGNTLSTAEQTLALLFALARHTPAAVGSLKQGKWERGRFTGTQLAGKTLGIVGLGRIGREVAKRALALDLVVIGFDPILPPERLTALGIQPAADLNDLLSHSDILTVHVPGGPETKGMIGAAELARLRAGSLVINCARGGIIDEAALAAALSSGHLAGAALDVFEQEPPAADHPLLALPNVICTPHLGASTREAQQSVAVEAAQLLVDFLVHGQVQAALNLAPLDAKELAELRPSLDLAHRLGMFLAQLQDGPLVRIKLSCQGDWGEHSPRLVTGAFLAGLLGRRLNEAVNLVNAELLARERGLEIETTQVRTSADFRALLRAELTTAHGRQAAAATLLGKQYPRLVQIGDYPLESYLDGILLLMQHRDQPGLIGLIGTVFGRCGVNIAQMVVGRQSQGGAAIAVLNLDSIPPPAALAEVAEHPAIDSVRVLTLPPMGELPPWLTAGPTR